MQVDQHQHHPQAQQALLNPAQEKLNKIDILLNHFNYVLMCLV